MQKIIVIVICIVVLIAGVFFLMDRPASPEPIVSETPVTAPDAIDETPEEIAIKIALIAIEDNGASGRKIGCDDSVVTVTRNIPYTTGTLRAALSELLSLEGTMYGESGLQNTLAASDLRLTDVHIENGTAVIELDGQLSLGGVCDAPRVQAQLEETALQFASVKDTEIILNGKPIAEALSTR